MEGMPIPVNPPRMEPRATKMLRLLYFFTEGVKDIVGTRVKYGLMARFFYRDVFKVDGNPLMPWLKPRTSGTLSAHMAFRIPS